MEKVASTSQYPKRWVRRRRVHDTAMAFEHNTDPCSGKRHTHCLATGCHNRLKVGQRGACSDACRRAVIKEAIRLVRLIGREEELLRIFLDQT